MVQEPNETFFLDPITIYEFWGDQKIDKTILSKIKDDLEDIPALIGLTDFATVSNDFKKNAMNNIIELNK